LAGARLLPYRRERPIPFLFELADIERVMRAARGLRGELHAATTQTLIGLMAVTGIRVGEAIGLGRDDVDRRERLIRVVDGKFGKSREVAVDETTIARLTAMPRFATRSVRARSATRSCSPQRHTPALPVHPPGVQAPCRGRRA
jgi:integrase